VKDLFVKLIRKFKDKLTDQTQQETRAINAHALSLAALNNEHTSLSALKSEKESRKGEAEGVRDQAKSDAASAKTAFDEFTKSLSDKEREYRDTTSNYNLVTKERQEEGKAMDIAVDVLKSISGVRADHEELPAATAAAFLQLAGLTPKDKVVQLLRTAGGKLHSAQLQKLAMEIGATKGPFNQINNMIQKMVDRLVTEQQKEDNHKAWCDNELEVTNAGHDDKDAKLQKIEADIDTATGKETSNKEDKADARKQISEGQKRKAGETEERRLQKNNNKVTIDDAKKAQKGLQQALTVLREWNEKRDTSVDPTAQNNKVFTLLEDAEVHYAKLEADIESADTQQETDFRQSMADIKKLVATLEAQVEGHNNTLHRLSPKLSSLGKKKKHTKDALFEFNQYLDDLKPACVGEEGAYEKRKENRKKEKDALKEAKGILADAFKNMAKPELVSVKKHVYTQ
jgi:chromosome segregation ATPase